MIFLKGNWKWVHLAEDSGFEGTENQAIWRIFGGNKNIYPREHWLMGNTWP